MSQDALEAERPGLCIVTVIDYPSVGLKASAIVAKLRSSPADLGVHGDDLPAYRSEFFDEADRSGWIVQADIVGNAIEIGDKMPAVENFH